MSAPYERLWRCEGVKGGSPCLRTTGILVEGVASRFAAGEPIPELARDFGVPEATITEAIWLVVDVKRPSLESKAAWARIAKVLPETRRP